MQTKQSATFEQGPRRSEQEGKTNLAPIITEATLSTAHPQPMSSTSFSSISSNAVAAV